ncbi:hypothetical protein QTP88_024563 [Uroleucon formosanum]
MRTIWLPSHDIILNRVYYYARMDYEIKNFRVPLKFGQRLCRTGACQNLTDVLETYGIHIAALQEIRWSGNGQLKVGKYIIYFSGMEERHIFESGFAVHETLEPYIKEFNPVSERIAVQRVDTKPLNIVLVCTHAPTETRDEDFKNALYEELAHTYDNLPGNVIKLMVGDLNAKCGREIQFNPTIGSESLHETSNGNGLRLIFFAAAKNKTISSTTFPHKDIHKATWKSPDGITTNQIDHILIQKRFRSCIKYIRSYRGADCNTDHFLVVAKFELKLQSRKQLEKENSRKINLEMLKDEEIQQKYSKIIGEYVKSMELNNIDEHWDKVSKTIRQIAVENIGMIRNKKKKWHNENCRKAIRKRQTARENYIEEDSTDTKSVYILERKMCKRVLQREKRKYLSEILQEAERNYSMGSVRNFFKTIKQYKTFNPSLKTIKNCHGVIFVIPKEKADRWKEYFTELLNADILDNSTRRKNIHGAEPMVSEVTREEVNEAIKDLKNWKSPGSDEIPAVLIKYGGKEMQNLLFRICQKIWKDESMPKSWNKAIVVPIYKKGDKSICEN